ncbi:hypothetical protein Cyast_2121 [Cyanobacterium stanieri PCC 7202]|uniref:DUF4335 domain-containing protein n=1 Tax=Cyanobacterium stanieri (strain ATCC 29140 / PCC 7202) TaxID=292563 RepID=K9YMA5_CYASC|nr:hypothetical protein Cyast_2121 [Cyanobacterium stanieri PCC 7202]
MSKESLYKSYTPPTCTLNIYNPPSFLPLKGQNLAPDYTFELSFDDPRMPSQDLIMLRGDRTLLEKMRAKMNQYLDKYLENLDFEQEEVNEEQNDDFLIVSNGQLYHRIKTEDHQSIKLTHTQFLDFTNALENFYLDFRDSENKVYSPFAPFKSIVGVSAIALMVVGGFWWYNSTTVTEEVEEIETATETEFPEFPEVEPPTPLDRDSLPPISLPDVPDNLLGRQPLPPPTGDIPLPPADFPPPPLENNGSGLELPAPPPPTSGNATPPPPTSGGSSPPPPADLAPAPQPLPRLGSNRPNLPPTPPLQARNPQANNDNNNDIPENDTPTPSQSPQEKVRNYFASRWQPPENLTQSIEYRLIITSEGSVSSISPIGQTAGFFIDRTPLPLRGETIISPLSESEAVRVRVIFSPDGNVNTFRE